MKLENLTDADATLIAAENGWEYLPACPEGYAAVASFPELPPAAPAVKTPPPSINRRALRRQIIRSAMPLVKQEIDAQQIMERIDLPELQRLLPDAEEREQYLMGVIRFCEHACFRSTVP